jgi:BatD DUF11 like domain
VNTITHQLAVCIAWPELAVKMLVISCISIAALIGPGPAPSTAATPAQNAADADVEVAAAFTEPATYVGTPTLFTISVRNGDDGAAPDLSGVAQDSNVEISYIGASDQSFVGMSIVNGRPTTTSVKTRLHQYQVKPTKPGTLTIPALTVQVRGRSFRTSASAIEVREVTASSDMQLTLSAGASTAYVGQPITLRLEWLIGREVKSGGLLWRVPSSGEDLPGVNPHPPSAVRGDRQNPWIRIGDQEYPAKTTWREARGMQVPVLVVERVFIPRAPGRLTLGPIRADFEAVYGERARQFFDSPFSDHRITRRQMAESNAIEVDVRPLPSQGRPANFSGLVGNYGLAVTTTTRFASVGDPVPLSIEVSGPHPLSLVPTFDLRSQPALASGFRTPRDPLLAESSTPTARFRGPVRPRSASVTSIPALELSYFDPVAGTYRVARSEPIPITVAPSTTVTLDGASASAESPSAGPTPQNEADPDDPPALAGLIDVEPRSIDGSTIVVSPQDPSNWRSPRGLALASAGVLVLIALFAALMSAVGIARRRELVVRRTRGRWALRAALDDPASVLPTGPITAMLAAWEDPQSRKNPHALTERESIDLLKRLGVEHPQATGVLLAQEQASFAPSSMTEHLTRAAIEAAIANQTRGPWTRERTESLARELERELVRAAKLAGRASRAQARSDVARPARISRGAHRTATIGAAAIFWTTLLGAVAAMSQRADARQAGHTDADQALVDAKTDPREVFDAGLALMRTEPRRARVVLLAASAGFEQWADAYQDNPRRAARALYNAGTAALHAGDLPRAMLNLRRAHRLDPLVPGLGTNLSRARALVSNPASTAQTSANPVGLPPRVDGASSKVPLIGLSRQLVAEGLLASATPAAFTVGITAWLVIAVASLVSVIAAITVLSLRSSAHVDISRRRWGSRLAIALGFVGLTLATTMLFVIARHRWADEAEGVVVASGAPLWTTRAVPTSGAASNTLAPGTEVRIIPDEVAVSAAATGRSPGPRLVRVEIRAASGQHTSLAERTQRTSNEQGTPPHEGWMLSDAIEPIVRNSSAGLN